MKIEKLDLKYNLVLAVHGGHKIAMDKDLNEIVDHSYDTFMHLVQITGIEAIFYCAVIKGELNVLTMYYVTGQSFFTESFVRKYLTGMKVKFVEPSISGAQKYFRSEN